MRDVPAGLQAHLDSGATTLAWCWRITRGDGVRLGFTDHDRDLVFDGTTFEAASGLTATDYQSEVGLAVGNQEVSGALRSDRLSPDDLAAGLYDSAGVEVFRVNWTDPSQRLLLRRGMVGEVKRGRTAFTAEVRGLAHSLQQEQGRVYQYGCDAVLGDARCGITLASPALTGTGTVASVEDERSFTASGLAAFVDGWLTGGLLTWTSGGNAGRRIEVSRHVGGAAPRITIWQAMAHPLTIGDAFSVSAGCDKTFTTCRAKFGNGINYRGFPHMPGNDFVVAYANSGDGTSTGAAIVS